MLIGSEINDDEDDIGFGAERSLLGVRGGCSDFDVMETINELNINVPSENEQVEFMNDYDTPLSKNTSNEVDFFLGDESKQRKNSDTDPTTVVRISNDIIERISVYLKRFVGHCPGMVGMLLTGADGSMISAYHTIEHSVNMDNVAMLSSSISDAGMTIFNEINSDVRHSVFIENSQYTICINVFFKHDKNLIFTLIMSRSIPLEHMQWIIRHVERDIADIANGNSSY